MGFQDSSIHLTGRSGDVRMERLDWDLSQITLSGTDIVFPTATASAKAMAPFASLTGGYGFVPLYVYGAIGRPLGTPTGEIGLLTNVTTSTAPTARWVRIGTDLRVKIYDASGNLKGSSTAQLSTVNDNELVIVFGAEDGGTIKVWLFINGVEDVAFDTGQTLTEFIGRIDTTPVLAWGDWLPSGVSYGVNMVWRDIYAEAWDNFATDNPTVRNLPRYRSYGGAALQPVAMGTYSEWDEGTHSGANAYQAIDEYPGDDETTYLLETDSTMQRRFTCIHNTPNTLPTSLNIKSVQLRHVGRLNGSAKMYCRALLKTSAGEVSTARQSNVSAAYRGVAFRSFTAPGGGSWQRSHFDPGALEFGQITDILSGVSTGPRITTLAGPEVIYYTDVLPLGTPLGARRRFIIT